MTAPASWSPLIVGVLADVDAIARETLVAIHEALPVYREVDEDEMLASLRLSFTRIVTSARDRTLDLDDAELEELAAGGRHRAAAGVPADAMLLAWRVGFQTLLARTRGIGDRQGIAAVDMLEFLQTLIAWSDRAMVVVSAAHHRAALELARSEQETRADVVRGMLLGTLAPHELLAAAAELGIDPEHGYVAVRAAVPSGMTIAEVRRVLGFGETVGDTRSQTVLVDGDVAGFLPTLSARAVRVVVGAGPAEPLARIDRSFTAATRALHTARAFGLEGVQRFDDLGLLPAVVADRAVGEQLRARYVTPLSDEIAQTVRTWLAAGAHVERAAEQLFVHPNTLRYRLSRFEELTGVSLKDPARQREAWWALQYASIDVGADHKEVRSAVRGR